MLWSHYLLLIKTKYTQSPFSLRGTWWPIYFNSWHISALASLDTKFNVLYAGIFCSLGLVTEECLISPEIFCFLCTSCVVTHYFQSVCMWSTTLPCTVRDHAYFLFSAEELLNNFAQQTGAWRHCLFFLSNTRNEYVMMYSLTVFEVSHVDGRHLFSVHSTVLYWPSLPFLSFENKISHREMYCFVGTEKRIYFMMFSCFLICLIPKQVS